MKYTYVWMFFIVSAAYCMDDRGDEDLEDIAYKGKVRWVENMQVDKKPGKKSVDKDTILKNNDPLIGKKKNEHTLPPNKSEDQDPVTS